MLSDRILRIVYELGLSQSEFSRMLGVSFAYVNMIVNKKRYKISRNMARAIQDKFGYSADWILTGEGDKRDMALYDNIINTIRRLPTNEIEVVFDYILLLENEQKKSGKP